MKTTTAIMIVFLAFLAISFAMEIRVIEEKETVAVGSNHFNISIDYDCDRTIKFSIRSDGMPVKAAMLFVFYEERYTSLLGAGETDSKGEYTYKIIGNPQNMINLFLVTVEKPEFRTKEAHFILPDAEDCIRQNKTAENATTNTTSNMMSENISSPQQNESWQEQANEEEQTPKEQATPGVQNETSGQKQAINANKTDTDEKGAGSAFCGGTFLLAIILLVTFSSFIARRHSSRI